MLHAQNVKPSPHGPKARLPVIDIAALYGADIFKKKLVGRDIAAACRDFGFFYIRNYHISETDIKHVFKQSKEFFGREDSFKNTWSINNNDRFQGYEPPTPWESKEAYVLGPERTEYDPLVRQGIKYHGSNQWPDITGWRPAVQPFMEDMLVLAKILNRGLALGLGLDTHFFDDLSKDPMYAFRMLHYPPAAHAADTGIETHTDWGALSLLIQDENEGLEIMPESGNAFIAPPVENTMVVNIGEMVDRWTNGALRATPHRVVNRSGRGRFSLAFFLDMDHDAIIQPVACVEGQKTLKYAPVKVSDFIDLMHERDYGFLSGRKTKHDSRL